VESDPARKLAIGAAVVALFGALTWFFLHFRLEYAGSRLPSDLGDPVLVLYFLEWGGRCLARGVRGYLEFWNANFFFPSEEVMAFSDHVLGPAVQTRLLHRLGSNEVGGYNFLFLGSFVLSGLTTSWVVRRAGAGLPASILAGIMFAFSPYRFDQRAHLQVLLMQWIPLVLWLWHRLLEEPVARRALPFVAVYALHVTGGMYLAYFLHFALAILLLQHLDRWRALVAPRALGVLIPTLLACAATAAAIFVPYLLARSQYDLGRSLGHIGYYGATLTSYLSIGTDNVAWSGLLARFVRPENQLFAGLVATALGVIGVRALWSRPRTMLYRVGGQAVKRLDPDRQVFVVGQRQRIVLALLLFLTCAGFVLGDVTTLTDAQEIEPGLVPAWLAGYLPAALLALGGGGSWLLLSRRWRGEWPLLPPSPSRWEGGLFLIGLFFALLPFPVVFASLARVIPGLDGMRVPTRGYPFLSFALVYFAARGLDWALARAQGGRRRQAVLAAVTVVLVVELRDSMQWYPWANRDQIPAIFHRIAEVPDVGAVLHLPIPPYPFEAHYMYYSIAHWRPIVNGYSGYEPPPYLEVKRRLKDDLYDAATLDYLSRLGVTHIAVHPFEFKMPRERRRLLRWERRWSEGPNVRLRPVLVAGRDRLWQLVPPSGSDPAAGAPAELPSPQASPRSSA
jgi:hypothetical protein